MEAARRWMKRLGMIALVLAVSYAVIVLTPWSVGLCAEDAVSEASSPDDSHLARTYIRNCGATTGYLTHVNLRGGWSYFNTTWVGTIIQGQVFGNACWSDVNLIWRDNSNLEIEYERCVLEKDEGDPAFMKVETWEGITISYRELPPKIEESTQAPAS